jgi:hypothetical protein
MTALKKAMKMKPAVTSTSCQMSSLCIQKRRQIYSYARKSQPITILQTFISCNFIFHYHYFFNRNVHSRNRYFLKFCMYCRNTVAFEHLNFVPASCYLNRCFIFILINTFVDFVFGIYSAELFLENTQYLLFLMVSLIYGLISSYLFFYLLFFCDNINDLK